MKKTVVLALALLAFASIAFTTCAFAQTYPDRVITLVAPFPPGGPSDTTARMIIGPMSQALGQQIIVENITGAGGITKAGTGIAKLTGANTYAGTTTVTAGTLTLGNRVSLYDGVTGSWTATNLIVANGATLALSVGDANGFTSADVARIAGLGTVGAGFQSGSSIGFDTTAGNFEYAGALGNPNGLMLHFDDEPTLFHMGDTDIFSDMGLINELHQPDIGILPVGDRFTMGGAVAALACQRFFNFKTAIPCHYGTFPIIDQTPEKFVAGMEGSKTAVAAPKVGESVSA